MGRQADWKDQLVRDEGSLHLQRLWLLCYVYRRLYLFPRQFALSRRFSKPAVFLPIDCRQATDVLLYAGNLLPQKKPAAAAERFLCCAVIKFSPSAKGKKSRGWLAGTASVSAAQRP